MTKQEVAAPNKDGVDPVALSGRLFLSAQTSFFLVLIIAAILGVAGGATLFLLKNQFVGGQLLGVSASLGAYVIATWLHDLLVREHAQRVVELSVRQAVTETFREIMLRDGVNVQNIVQSAADQIRAMEKEYFAVLLKQFPTFIPQNVFPPSDASNPEFVNSLKQALSLSAEFYFKGVTARHVPLLLERERPTNVRCNILILDPRLDGEIWLYAQNRYSQEANINSRRTEYIDRVRQEIFASIVALWDCSSICPIVIKIHNGPVFYRTEMFDDRAFISFYVASSHFVYPVSYEYDSSSFYYKAFRRDIRDAISISGQTLDAVPGGSESRLEGFLEALGCSLSVGELRDQFASFRAVAS